LLTGRRISEQGGKLRGQVPVVSHKRSSQRRLAFTLVAKPLCEVLYPFVMGGSLRVRGSPGK